MTKKYLNYHTIAFISQASKVMLKILQARLQQYMNRELPDVQAGFRKGRGTRDQIANICWIIKKTGEYQKNIDFCFIDYANAFDCVDHNKLENSSRDGNTRPPYLPPRMKTRDLWQRVVGLLPATEPREATGLQEWWMVERGPRATVWWKPGCFCSPPQLRQESTRRSSAQEL